MTFASGIMKAVSNSKSINLDGPKTGEVSPLGEVFDQWVCALNT
jgi:hypothetical protein